MRVIPVLLLDNKRLVKTVQFKKPVYVGDPINAVRIFNEKDVDELVLLDISASKENRKPDFNLLEDIVSEAFMPIGYGGGIKSLEDARTLFSLGIEKVILNSLLIENEKEVEKLVSDYGSQSVVACIDFKKNLFGKKNPFFKGLSKTLSGDVLDFAKKMQNIGVGEIIIQSVDKDGTGTGYDLELLNLISKSVSVPVVIAGGAASGTDFKLALENGASAAAAGSMFVFNGKHRAVLISYTNKF
jgi:cyclase